MMQKKNVLKSSKDIKFIFPNFFLLLEMRNRLLKIAHDYPVLVSIETEVGRRVNFSNKTYVTTGGYFRKSSQAAAEFMVSCGENC